MVSKFVSLGPSPGCYAHVNNPVTVRVSVQSIISLLPLSEYNPNPFSIIINVLHLYFFRSGVSVNFLYLLFGHDKFSITLSSLIPPNP